MKQKKLGNILYVFDVMPYEITQDTDVEIIKVQEESYNGFLDMNQSLAEKIVKYNYHTMCVNVPEWAPYVEQEDPQGQLTFGIYGAGAIDAINQIQVQDADNVILESWNAGVNLEFPFQATFDEGQHFAVEFADGVNPDLLDIIGDALSIGWQDAETNNFWRATPALSASTSVGIESSEPSTHEVVINSDITMTEIMEQTPDHQTIVNTYTSPSSPFIMTVNDGNIVTVEFDNGEPSYIYDISPIGFFSGQWQNPDTGKYISWSEPISDDVNVTIQPRNYTVTLDGGDIHSHVTVKMNGETVQTNIEYQNVADGTVVDVYPTDNVDDYVLISGAVWDTDHWTATVNGADLTISINYLGEGVNFNASWYQGSTPENLDQINIGSTPVTSNALTDPSWTDTVRLYPGTSSVNFYISTGLPIDMKTFMIDFTYQVDGHEDWEQHYAYKQTDPDTGEAWYSDARDASGGSVSNPGIWEYNNTPDTGLPYITFTLPSTDKNGNAFADNTSIQIYVQVSGS